MKTRLLPAVCLVLLLLGGCETRSISDSGYKRGGSNRYYRGELSEAEVVGKPDSGHAVTEADIQRAAQ